ncbi:MAG TPA: NrfD/PsrC family molybdoenzyme membrane anchor subunit [Candidatus Dormibacteraeota bacterium]
MLLAEHFARAPAWGVWILLYFFFAGIAGGAYVIATLVRLRGGDGPVARTGYLLALPCVVLCPIFLTIDLGQPLRFWHMMINTSPGGVGLNLNTATPMSLGVWALLVYGFFTFVSFVAELGFLPPLRAGTPLGTFFAVIGSLFGLFIAGYTGVLLSVSNQPVWSDTPVLGGLFLASGMSGAAAAIWLLGGRRGPAAMGDFEGLDTAAFYFAVLELLLLLVFFVTIAAAGSLGTALRLPWTLLWLLALLALAFPLAGMGRRGIAVDRGGAAVLTGNATLVAVVVLVGVLALRAAVIGSAQ